MLKMGVMSCYRTNCDNIMCDTYVQGVGYICSDCQSEFKEYLISKGKTEISEFEIKKELKIFLETDKDDFNTSGDKIDVDDFFNSYTS